MHARDPNEPAPDPEDADPGVGPLDPHPDTPDEGEGEEIGRESVETVHEESLRDELPADD